MNRRKRANGIVIPMALCIIFLLFVMGVAFTETVGVQYRMAGEKEYGLAALYTADAGISYALALMKYKANLGQFDFLQDGFWGPKTIGTLKMGKYEAVYRILKSTEITPNPENLPAQVYILHLEVQGMVARPDGSVLASRTIFVQVLVSVTTKEVHIYKWFEKYKSG
ncbi:MAG: hypothetical protein J7M18_03670 [Candidatus Eremiobacteraeota bacterium]|nr:hypothetical protein [Candidatus Eremiobacteraeota bacterium]